jgi:hypothetical protein
MKKTWTVPEFTPAKFALLALIALTLAGVSNGFSMHRYRVAHDENPTLLRPIDAVGQGNGSLAANLFVPAPPPHVPNPGSSPAPVVRPTYPPLSR